MVRIAKLGRMQKLIKLTRLIRIIKVVKNKNSMLQQVKDLFGAGFERLMFFILISLMICHIFACLWVFSSQIIKEENSFMSGEVLEMPVEQQYLTSVYFIITTFSTVGYGDISASNTSEKIFCIIIMIVGVTAFAAGTSTLTNLLQTYDTENKLLQEKVDILNRIKKEYYLPLKLYENVKKSIKY